MRSYRDLPLRYGEFGACHRNEPSGALHGIMRVRGSRRTTATSSAPRTRSRRVAAFNQLALDVYRDFGFTDVTIKLALRPDQRLGDDATWDRAEDALRNALRECGVEWIELPARARSTAPRSSIT
jgi:threonyl-tRNA synthetase